MDEVGFGELFGWRSEARDQSSEMAAEAAGTAAPHSGQRSGVARRPYPPCRHLPLSSLRFLLHQRVRQPPGGVKKTNNNNQLGATTARLEPPPSALSYVVLTYTPTTSHQCSASGRSYESMFSLTHPLGKPM